MIEKVGVYCRLSNEDRDKVNKNDLQAKAREIGATQLSAPIFYPIQNKKHKEIINLLNSTIEQILLENKNILQTLKILGENWLLLIN